MPNCTSSSEGTDFIPGGWYESDNGNALSNQVSCANAQSPGSVCMGEPCSKILSPDSVGWCLCADGSLRYLLKGHDSTSCDQACDSPAPPEIATSWTDSADCKTSSCASMSDESKIKRYIAVSVAVLALIVLIAVLRAKHGISLKRLSKLSTSLKKI